MSGSETGNLQESVKWKFIPPPHMLSALDELSPLDMHALVIYSKV